METCVVDGKKYKRVKSETGMCDGCAAKDDLVLCGDLNGCDDGESIWIEDTTTEPVITGETLAWDYATRNKYTVLLAESEIGEFYITPQAGQARYLLVYHDGQTPRHMQADFSIATLIDIAESFVASRALLPVEVVR